jgi:hypothetical protein
MVARVTAGCRHQVGGIAQPGRRLGQRHGGGRRSGNRANESPCLRESVFTKIRFVKAAVRERVCRSPRKLRCIAPE